MRWEFSLTKPTAQVKSVETSWSSFCISACDLFKVIGYLPIEQTLDN